MSSCTSSSYNHDTSNAVIATATVVSITTQDDNDNHLVEVPVLSVHQPQQATTVQHRRRRQQQYDYMPSYKDQCQSVLILDPQHVAALQQLDNTTIADEEYPSESQHVSDLQVTLRPMDDTYDAAPKVYSTKKTTFRRQSPTVSTTNDDDEEELFC